MPPEATPSPPAGPWLDDGRQRAWLAYMRVQLRMSFEMNRQLQADSGLSLADYDVLTALSGAPGASPAGDRARGRDRLGAQPGLAPGQADERARARPLRPGAGRPPGHRGDADRRGPGRDRGGRGRPRRPGAPAVLRRPAARAAGPASARPWKRSTRTSSKRERCRARPAPSRPPPAAGRPDVLGVDLLGDLAADVAQLGHLLGAERVEDVLPDRLDVARARPARRPRSRRR